MSADTVSSEGASPGFAREERAPGALRILGMTAVCVGLAALAGGTFVLSYSGIHALALHAGITPRLARGYPLLIDAMLVIVLAAVLALRGADLPSRLFAWATLLALLAAAAGADALHAAGRRLPVHVAAITAAVLPWVLLFLAFALLLAMLRHARLRRHTSARALQASLPDIPEEWLPSSQDEGPQVSGIRAAGIVPGLELPVRQPQPPAALPVDPDAGAGQSEEADETDQVEHADEIDKPDESGTEADRGDQAGPAGEHEEQDDPDMPVFHRIWSSPTPPEPTA